MYVVTAVVWVQDVVESACVAVQLTKRGRKGERGGGMDVENVREFLRQVESLPCRIPEARLLEVSAQLWSRDRESGWSKPPSLSPYPSLPIPPYPSLPGPSERGGVVPGGG